MIRPERKAASGHAPQVGLGGARPILAMTDVGACWMLLDCWNFADPWYYIQPQCDSKAGNTCLTAGLWESRLMLWQRLELECEELSVRTRSLWNLLLSSFISFFLWLTYSFSATLPGIVISPLKWSVNSQKWTPWLFFSHDYFGYVSI